MHCFSLLLVVFGFLFASEAMAQRGESTKIEGVLETAETKEGDIQKYVLVVDDTRYQLNLPKQIQSGIAGAVGRVVQINGTVLTSDDDETKTIQVTGFGVARKLSPAQKVAMADRLEQQKKRYQDSQAPMSDAEREAAQAEFGQDSPILDDELKLRHTLKLAAHGSSGCNRWEFHPDGTFEKYVYTRRFHRDGGTRRHVIGKGTISTRQTIELAKQIANSKLLELPEKIDDGIEIDPRFGRASPGAYTLEFGDFTCVGGQPYKDTDQSPEIQEQQRRLSSVAFGFTRTGSFNLKHQDQDE